MKKLRNIHPGEILNVEFLIPFEISAYRLSKDIGIPQTRISEIVKRQQENFSGYGIKVIPVFW